MILIYGLGNLTWKYKYNEQQHIKHGKRSMVFLQPAV